jgi:hypothetical protein
MCRRKSPDLKGMESGERVKFTFDPAVESKDEKDQKNRRSGAEGI